jgi:hypothetical protein
MRKWLETFTCLVGMRARTHDNTQIWNRIECKLIYKTIIFERKVSVLCKHMLPFYLWYRVCVLMLNLTIEYINSNDVHYLIDNKCIETKGKHILITKSNTIHPSRAPEFILGFYWDSCRSVFSFLVVVLFLLCNDRCFLLSFFFWPLYCLSYFCWRLLITPLLSSNSPLHSPFLKPLKQMIKIYPN